MSEVFFTQLGLPEPDINLEVGSASHAVQTAQIMISFENVVLPDRPDMVLVYGDINSTVAATLVCAKLGIPVGHVEAGLRSGDRTMPEEINRLVTDQIADLLLTPSSDGDENLLSEGVAPEKIRLVGNVMIDTLVRLLPEAEKGNTLARMGLTAQGYGLVTLHRPSNVDDPETLQSIMSALAKISRDIPLIFPIHPRTRQRLHTMGFSVPDTQMQFVEPLSYLDFLALQRYATFVISDSGGIQEETTYMGIPCLTVRENTERPITVTMGTNTLVGVDMQLLRSEVDKILAGEGKSGSIPPLWDGHAGERIADVLLGGAYLFSND